MHILNYDAVVIGGGPAGLAAASKIKEKVDKVLIIERNFELGGILNQCIHSGFGIEYFREELTGPEYAQRFIDIIESKNIDVYLNTMVIEINKDKMITAISSNGLIKIMAKSIVLAMGCRERTRGSIRIPGTRPAGVYSAGLVQKYMNIENLNVGKKAVILGSGDIGLIMARRLTIEGIKVVGVYEIMPYANGLVRNIKQCLEDFNIPLHLSTTISRIVGKDRVKGVMISKCNDKLEIVDENFQFIECDTVILSVGLISENELSLKAGIKLNKKRNTPIVNQNLETSIPGIFACGNVLHVHDLVDNVTKEAEVVGLNVIKSINGIISKNTEILLEIGKNINYVTPEIITNKLCNKQHINFRVKKPINQGRLTVKYGQEIVFIDKPKKYLPSKMCQVILKLDLSKYSDGDNLLIEIQEESL